MIGFYKNAPKDEEWLREKIARAFYVSNKWNGGEMHSWDDCNQSSYYTEADQIIAKMKEGGWVSPADQKEALSRELAAGYRLAVNKPKEVNDESLRD